jgi:hypothetical protein
MNSPTGRIPREPEMQRMPSANYWIQAVKAEKMMASLHDDLMKIPGVKWDGADGYEIPNEVDWSGIEERVMAHLQGEEPTE